MTSLTGCPALDAFRALTCSAIVVLVIRGSSTARRSRPAGQTAHKMSVDKEHRSYLVLVQCFAD